MKKFLLLIPAGLLAATGLVWINSEYNGPKNVAVPSVKALPQNSVDIFTMNEHSVRQIVRYGDEKAIPSFKASLYALDSSLLKDKKLGFDTENVRHMISQYKEESTNLTQTASHYSKQLQTYNNFEQNNEKRFLLSLEQIGLYELKKTLEDLDKTRLSYIKEPSQVTQKEYEELSSKMKDIISELYLDAAIEGPLLAYISNHNHYFQTVVSIYMATGVESIKRLRENSYAIKAQLQLLPKS